MEYAFATPEDLGGADRYRAWCAAAGLPVVAGGYGLLMMNGPFGHVTRLTEDVEYLRTLVAASRTETGVGGLDVPPDVFPLTRPGWPDDWATAARP